MTKTVTIVSGFGRCGSSMTMQMLSAGGYPTTGRYPAFEPPETSMLSFDPGWVAAQRGAAVKWCDPHYDDRNLDPGKYRSIWLDRDRKQQALSQIKFGSLLGNPLDASVRKALRIGYRNDRPKAVAKLKTYGRVLFLRFEYILHSPIGAAKMMSDFVGGMDVEAAAAVVRDRGPECYDGLLELELIEEQNSGTA